LRRRRIRWTLHSGNAQPGNAETPPPQVNYWYEYYTNTSQDGSYQFSNIPFVPGWYFVTAYATDATSQLGQQYDVRVVSGGCATYDPNPQSPCISSRYGRSLWWTHLDSVPLNGLDVPPVEVPAATTFEQSSAAPGQAFLIQSAVAVRSAPYIDSLNQGAMDHWNRGEGRYRTRYLYPRAGYEASGWGWWVGTFEWGSNIVIGGPGVGEGTVHHEYGHHTLGVQHSPPNQNLSSRMDEGWANFYEAHVLGSASSLEYTGAGWYDGCPDESGKVGSNSAAAMNVAALFYDLDDNYGSECWDTLVNGVAAAYDVYSRKRPIFMWQFIQKWGEGPPAPYYSEALHVWQYHGYNQTQEPKIPGCPGPPPGER